MTGREIYNKMVLIQKDYPYAKFFLTLTTDICSCDLNNITTFKVGAGLVEFRGDSGFVRIKELHEDYEFDFSINHIKITKRKIVVNNPRGAGRKRQISLETVADLYNQGMTMQYIADDLGCSIGSVSNAVKECRREGLVKQKDKYTSNSFHYKKTW